MSSKMKVEQVSKKFIKPYTPTPQTLKNYKLSSIDELIPPIKLSILLFYPSNKHSNPNPIQIHLEESLAKILVQFYPLAGRYNNDYNSIDCNDEGAEFIQAQAYDVHLNDLVTKTTSLDQLNPLLPPDQGSHYPLLSIQITQLINGGLVLGLSICHRVFDASSIGTFIAAWSKATNQSDQKENNITILPDFNSPSLFPSQNQSPKPLLKEPQDHDNKIVAMRVAFKNEAITSLRSKLTLDHTKMAVSRVRMVCSLIAMVLVYMDRAKHGRSRPCFILMPIDIRERTIPPLPHHSCGNLSTLSFAQCMAKDDDEDMYGLVQELVNIIGNAIEKTVGDCGTMLTRRPTNGSGDDSEMVKEIEVSGVNAMMFSDWSKFGYYDADFGWGKPIWTSIGQMPRPYITVLMDDKQGDGIEAWVHLNHDDVAYFEEHELLKLFANK